MKWKEKLINQLLPQLSIGEEWILVKNKILNKEPIAIHLAIFSEPYLTDILEGRKTVESRFSINRVSPYRKVDKGDLICIKKTGGAILGIFISGNVEYWSRLNSSKALEIKNLYEQEIGSFKDPLFWESRSDCNFASIIHVSKVKKIQPIIISKSDRTAWSIIQDKTLKIF